MLKPDPPEYEEADIPEFILPGSQDSIPPLKSLPFILNMNELKTEFQDRVVMEASLNIEDLMKNQRAASGAQ